MRQRDLILLGGAIVVILCCCGGVIVYSLVTVQPTPIPTLEALDVGDIIQATAAAAQTQTAAANPMPTQTIVVVPSDTPIPFIEPTMTTVPISTPFFTPTLGPNCIAAYPDFCIPQGERVACEQLPFNFTVLPPDPFNYDGDGDGVGCEQ